MGMDIGQPDVARKIIQLPARTCTSNESSATTSLAPRPSEPMSSNYGSVAPSISSVAAPSATHSPSEPVSTEKKKKQRPRGKKTHKTGVSKRGHRGLRGKHQQSAVLTGGYGEGGAEDEEMDDMCDTEDIARPLYTLSRVSDWGTSYSTSQNQKPFNLEAYVWFNILQFNVLEQNITVPGFSPLYPDAHCTSDGEICLPTTGQPEINAAATISALVYSLLSTSHAPISLSLGLPASIPKWPLSAPRYAVQAGLQYGFDAREIHAQFPTVYFPQGSTPPGQLPGWWDGTEVFEVNENLRQLARSASTIVLCHPATSDAYWSGNPLGEAFENTTRLFTNGSATYCTTQLEDSSSLAVLMRAAMFRLVDFSRIIRIYLGNPPGIVPSLLNLHLAGAAVVQGILNEWDSKYVHDVQADNYIGGVFGSLGGQPDFGPGFGG
ncbi:purine nucleoside permease-domain-containing protein [Mycena haematopus]|nr:purine nucleoside permease-domain-containing protein [Mycena haematopus]